MAYHEPTSEVELAISCSDLPNMDTFSKSDPMVVVYTEASPGEWRILGKTETIWDNLNPHFSKSFPLQYYFERVQRFRFEVYDIDDEKARSKLELQDFIGRAELQLAEIVRAPGGLTVPLLARNGSLGKGTITLTAEELSGANNEIHFAVVGTQLASLDFFGSSDPMLVLYRAGADGTCEAAPEVAMYTDLTSALLTGIKVHETEPVKNNTNPKWQPFALSTKKLANNDPARVTQHPSQTYCSECYGAGREHCKFRMPAARMQPILVEVLDWEASGDHRPIGFFTTTLSQLTGPDRLRQLPLRHPQLGKAKAVGMLLLQRCEVLVKPSFVEYLQSGTEIQLMVAIDFTGSNGNPKAKNSLHYIHPRASVMNDYQATIEKVGSILSAYDHDGMIPAFGFGARFPDGSVSHCFNLNSQADPACHGVADVLRSYKAAITALELYGPTNFATFLREAETTARQAREAQQSQNGQEYIILLVITDGVITDMRETVSAIVRASGLPLSIVIVGVGDADFTAMEILDADEAPLRCAATGRVMERDIVQFVPYRDFKKVGPDLLAQEVLAEIPEQLVGYMTSHGIFPPSATSTGEESAAASRLFDTAGKQQSAALGVPSAPAADAVALEQQRRNQAATNLAAEIGRTSAMEAQLVSVRSEMAAESNTQQILHEGLLGLQIDGEKQWQSKWCRLVARGGQPAVFEVLSSCRQQDEVHLTVPITDTSPFVRPWPKTARPEAPDAFRMDLVEQPVLSCEDDGASRPKKLILNPTTQNMPSSAGVSNKRAWLIALAAATSVADMRLSSQPMSVSIPIVTVDLVDGHQVALYHCLVVDSLNGAQQRLGSHRYSDFGRLFDALRARYHRVIPSCPPKRFLKLNPAVMESRRQELQAWLRMLSINPRVIGDRVFREFVGLAV